MPGKRRIFLDVDDLLNHHARGESIGAAARRLGVNHKTVINSIREAGREGEIRDPGAPHPIAPDVTARLCADYASGASVLALARREGLQRSQVERVLRLAGIAKRTASEQERIKWEGIKRTEGATERQCHAAWNASRGAPKSYETRCKIAIGNERSQSRIGVWETEIADALRGRGFDVVQQKAIGPYNVDVAMVADRVAVEVVGSKFAGVKAAHHLKKSEHLRGEGWAVFWVYTFHGTPNVGRIAEHLVAHAKFVRHDEAARGQDWVLRCDGKLTTPRGLDLEGWPLVVTTDGRNEGAGHGAVG